MDFLTTIVHDWGYLLTLVVFLIATIIAIMDVSLGARVHKNIRGDFSSAQLKNGIITHCYHIMLPVIGLLVIDFLASAGCYVNEVQLFETLRLLIIPVLGGITLGDFNSLRANMKLLGDNSFDKVNISMLQQEISEKNKKADQ